MPCFAWLLTVLLNCSRIPSSLPRLPPRLLLQAGDAAGADKTELAPDVNAVVTFDGNFAGPCTTTALNGTESTAPCADGSVRVSVQYYEDADLFTATKEEPLLTAAGLDAIEVVSGVVSLSMSGQDDADGGLPCAGGPGNGCAADMSLPLFEAPNASKPIVCLRVEGLPDGPTSFAGYPNGSGSGYSLAKVLPADTDALPTGAGVCRASRGGYYLLARATPTPRNDPAAGTPEPTTAPANTTGYTFVVSFTMDFPTLAADAARMAAFRLAARTAMAAAAQLPLDNVLITSVVAGSVVVTFDVHVPQAWNTSQVSTLAALVTATPAAVFDAAFQTAWSITGVAARLTTPLPAAPANILPLAIGIGVGVGGGLLIVLVVVLIVLRRRRAGGVEPRNGRGPAEEP